MTVENDSFLWGVASSGYQHEGGYNQIGLPLNNWYKWESQKRVASSGHSVDFWNRYEEDFRLARSIGLNSYRISIEWARIQPTRNPNEKGIPHFDDNAVNHYARIIATARKYGLEPLVTLFHFSHPYWLGLDPWLSLETPLIFGDYVEMLIEKLNARLITLGSKPLKWLLTVNEPNMLIINTYHAKSFPAGKRSGAQVALKALMCLCLAHAEAYKRIHQVYANHPEWERPMVSFNTYASDLYWMDKFLIDILSAPSQGVDRDHIFEWLRDRYNDFNSQFDQALFPLDRTPTFWLGTLVKWIHHWIGITLMSPRTFEHLLNYIYSEPSCCWMDYICFDYYDPFVENMFRFPRFDEMIQQNLKLRDWIVHSFTSKWWDWRVLPQGLRFFVELYARDFPKLPIIVAENGMALRQADAADHLWREDYISRSDYIRKHLQVVNELRQEGLPINGYFHWSLTDNYEWGSYIPRFGLFNIDFDSPDLTRRSHDLRGDQPAQTYAEMIQTSKKPSGEAL